MCILIIRDNLQNWPSARQTNLMDGTLSVQIFIMPSNLDISVVHFLFDLVSFGHRESKSGPTSHC